MKRVSCKVLTSQKLPRQERNKGDLVRVHFVSRVMNEQRSQQ